MAGIQDFIGSSGTLLTGSHFAPVDVVIEGQKAKRNLIIGGVIAALLIAAGVGYALYRRSKAKQVKEERAKNRAGSSRARRVKRRHNRKANPAPASAPVKVKAKAKVKRSRTRRAKRPLHPAFVAHIKRKKTAAKAEVKEAA